MFGIVFWFQKCSFDFENVKSFFFPSQLWSLKGFCVEWFALQGHRSFPLIGFISDFNDTCRGSSRAHGGPPGVYRSKTLRAAGSLQSVDAGTKSQQTASAVRLLSIPTTPNRKASPLLRARCAASPGDRYVTPPKTLWHNYASVAEQPRGGGSVGGGAEWLSERRSGGCVGWWCSWMLYSWLIQRDSPRDASRSSNKALLLFFFFLPFLSLCIAGCAPVKSSESQSLPPSLPQPFEDA